VLITAIRDSKRTVCSYTIRLAQYDRLRQQHLSFFYYLYSIKAGMCTLIVAITLTIVIYKSFNKIKKYELQQDYHKE